MSSADTILSVDGVLAFSDAELVEYMKQHQHPDGSFELGNIDGWDKLPKDQRDRLAERLRFGAQKANDAAPSRPVDFDQVAARLREISADRQPSATRPSRRLEDQIAARKELGKAYETEFYNRLVSDGGRPVYPLHLIDDVSQHPRKYRELLQAWQGLWPGVDPPEWECVFQRQFERWQRFLDWQQDNRGRGLFNAEEEFAQFVAKERHAEADKPAGLQWPRDPVMAKEREYVEFLKTEYQKASGNTVSDEEDEGFLAFREERRQEALGDGLTWAAKTEDEYLRALRNKFDKQQNFRYWYNFYWLREDHGRGDFPEYVDEAKRRLKRHGFTRTFEFDEDPKRQDKMATWIEYFNFECSWHDRYTRMVKDLQLKRDEAWKELADSGVLRPGESEEYLLSMEAGFRRQSDLDQARMAVEYAESLGEAALRESAKGRADPRRSRFTKEERTRRLAAAYTKVMAAKAASRAAKRRDNAIAKFIKKTNFYREQKDRLWSQSLVVQWIQKQIPLIEAELDGSKGPSDTSHAVRGVENEGNRHGAENEADSEAEDSRSTRRSRRDQASSASTSPSAGARQPRKRGRFHSTNDDSRPAKRARHAVSGSNSRDAMPTRDPQGSQTTAAGSQVEPDRAVAEGGNVSSRPSRRGHSVPSPAIPRQFRRSARIAARRDPSTLTVVSQRVVDSTRSRPRRKATKAPSSP